MDGKLACRSGGTQSRALSALSRTRLPRRLRHLAMTTHGALMSRKEMPAESVAEAYLALLAERGVEYLFANAGTDFAPIVEAYAKAAHTGLPAPKPLIA